MIYDETELLGFTALALPAGKNLTATYGIYSERKQHYIESFPCIPAPSQQVMENSVLQKHARIQNQIFAVRRRRGGLRATPLSDLSTYSKSAPALPFQGRREPTPRTPGTAAGGAERSTGNAGGRRGTGAAVLPSPLSGGHTRPAAAEGKKVAGAAFSGANKTLPEHLRLSRCNRVDAGRRRGRNVCQLGTPIFVPEISCRCSHVTWCVLIQQGGQYALFCVNPRLPAPSPHKITAWRNDTGKDGRAVAKALLTKRLRNENAAPWGYLCSPPPSRGVHGTLFAVAPPAESLAPSTPPLPVAPPASAGAPVPAAAGEGSPEPGAPPSPPSLDPGLWGGACFRGPRRCGVSGGVCPLWGQRACEGTRGAPHGHSPAFCPPPTLSLLPTDRSPALS